MKLGDYVILDMAAIKAAGISDQFIQEVMGMKENEVYAVLGTTEDYCVILAGVQDPIWADWLVEVSK